MPRKERTYLMLREEKEEVREFVEEQLRKGYIRPLKLPQTSPVFFVEKKDRKKRIVQDYRYLNKDTVKDNYPLSLISDLIDTMGTKKVFTKMDLYWGYNNVWIKERDEWKVTFTMHLGVYKSTVMFFSLTNSLVTFQAIMDNILRDLIDTGDMAAFMDNILVGTENERRYNEIVEEVLKRIEANDLYVKLEKCVWKVIEIDFLGLVMSTEGIKMQEEKVAGVLEWPRPKMVKNVQKFLGLANYYRQFMKDFARIAKLLHKLVRKDKKENWGEKKEKMFEELKNVIRQLLEKKLFPMYSSTW